jgi:hypothetical protein
MKRNVGSVDKVIRTLIALVIVILAFTKVITGVLAILLLVLAGILVLTSLISFCPIWRVLGISSAKKQE